MSLEANSQEVIIENRYGNNAQCLRSCGGYNIMASCRKVGAL